MNKYARNNAPNGSKILPLLVTTQNRYTNTKSTSTNTANPVYPNKIPVINKQNTLPQLKQIPHNVANDLPIPLMHILSGNKTTNNGTPNPTPAISPAANL